MCLYDFGSVKKEEIMSKDIDWAQASIQAEGFETDYYKKIRGFYRMNNVKVLTIKSLVS